MGWTDDDIVTRMAVDRTMAAATADEEDAVEVNRADNMTIDPASDVDEWLAEEVGYGYGV